MDKNVNHIVFRQYISFRLNWHEICLTFVIPKRERYTTKIWEVLIMKSKFAIGITVLLLAVGVIGCSYNLNVENRTSRTLDIYVDSYFEGSVAGGNSLFIRNIFHGEHLIEAIDAKGVVVADDIIYLDEDTTWVISENGRRR